MLRQSVVATFVAIAAPLTLNAQNAQQIARLGSCRLDGGAVLQECRVGYRTLGALNADRSNAVLLTTWFAGTSEAVSGYVGPGRLIDSSKWFVIVVDALGNGVSSSPHSVADKPDDSFPTITIGDMVTTQHRLLTEVLGVGRLHAVVGISMGGMQVFEWVVRYPDYMARAIPIVGTPQLTSHDLLLWQTFAKAVASCRVSICSNSGALAGLIWGLVSHSPQHRVTATRRDEVGVAFTQLQDQGGHSFSPALIQGQVGAMLAHDVAARYAGSMERAASRVRAKMLVIVATHDHVVRPEPALAFARLVGAEVLESASPCGHQFVDCELDQLNQRINGFLSRPASLNH